MDQENFCNLEDSIKLGPWGSQHQRGTHWSLKPEGLFTEIIISHGYFIKSISFKSDDTNETINEYSKKFACEGIKTDKVSLDSPREYLTSISGTHDVHNDVIQSLCFYSNRTKYGPFGTKMDKYNMYNYRDFNLSMEGGVIVGFHGRYGGLFLYTIGVYVKHAADVLLSSSRQGQIATKKVTDVVVNVEMSREAGPWGGNKGKSWDDGISSAVELVNVHVGNGIVQAVQFFYRSRDGKSAWSIMHGTGGDESTLHRIKLDCSNEYLVGMVGFYGPIEENGGFESVRARSKIQSDMDNNIHTRELGKDNSGITQKIWTGYINFTGPNGSIFQPQLIDKMDPCMDSSIYRFRYPSQQLDMSYSGRCMAIEFCDVKKKNVYSISQPTKWSLKF